MNRFWSSLFLLVPILGVASFFMAAFNIWPLQGLWLPDNYSETGRTIDHLWTLLHTICAVIFLVTGIVLAWALWRAGTGLNKATYFTHNTRLEIIWSIIPGGILVFIAIYQMQSWNENKLLHPKELVNGVSVSRPPLVRVVARRFSWEFHYPGSDEKLETIDDLYFENEMVLPYGEDVVLQLESRDVIHSFFVPKLRVKQDIIPGHAQMIWFQATQEAEVALVCAELCGWGHYAMQGRIKFVSRAEFDSWLTKQMELKSLSQKGSAASKGGLVQTSLETVSINESGQ